MICGASTCPTKQNNNSSSSNDDDKDNDNKEDKHEQSCACTRISLGLHTTRRNKILHKTHHDHREKFRVYGVRPEGNVDPAMDAHGELTSQNVLFESETVQEAVEALGVSVWESE